MPRKLSDLSKRTRAARRNRILRARKRAENQRNTDSQRVEEHADEILCEQFMALKRKIKEEFYLHNGQNYDISSIHTQITIKQEDPEDIDISVPPIFSVSCSQMNTACGSLKKELHIKTSYDSQNIMDVIEVKKEPGSPVSDVSIHLDAADSPEEQAIINELRNKMKMLIENEEILNKRREEISILENNKKELLADIKYLQKISKKNKNSLS